MKKKILDFLSFPLNFKSLFQCSDLGTRNLSSMNYFVVVLRSCEEGRQEDSCEEGRQEASCEEGRQEASCEEGC